jgi:hypothetical protein
VHSDAAGEERTDKIQYAGVQFIYSPWHSLNETFTEMVEGYCHLHCLVLHIGVTVAQKHHLHQFQFSPLDEKSNQAVSREHRQKLIIHVTVRYYSTILSISNRQFLVGFERIIRMKELILNYTCTGRKQTNSQAYMCQTM